MVFSEETQLYTSNFPESYETTIQQRKNLTKASFTNQNNEQLVTNSIDNVFEFENPSHADFMLRKIRQKGID